MMNLHRITVLFYTFLLINIFSGNISLAQEFPNYQDKFWHAFDKTDYEKLTKYLRPKISLFGEVLKLSADINKRRNSTQETALMAAVRKRDWVLTDFLLNWHANPYLENARGETAISLAEKGGAVGQMRKRIEEMKAAEKLREMAKKKAEEEARQKQELRKNKELFHIKFTIKMQEQDQLTRNACQRVPSFAPQIDTVVNPWNKIYHLFLGSKTVRNLPRSWAIGLSDEELARVVSFIELNRNNGNIGPGKKNLYQAGHNGLPVDIEVFPEGDIYLNFPGKVAGGSYKSISKSVHYETGEVFAVVEARAQSRSASDIQFLEQELNRQKKFSSIPGFPSIHRIEKRVQSPSGVLVQRVWQPMYYSDLAGIINKKTILPEKASLSVDQEKQIALELLKSLTVLHRNKILHRDIKPENVLIGLGPKELHVALTDFGLSVEDTDEQAKKGLAYTHGFLSPRLAYYHFVSHGGKLSPPSYNQFDDSWSLGILLYELKYKKMPFWHRNKNDPDYHRQIQQLILDPTYAQKDPYLNSPHPDPLDKVIRGLLRPNQAQSMTLEEAMAILNDPPPAPLMKEEKEEKEEEKWQGQHSHKMFQVWDAHRPSYDRREYVRLGIKHLHVGPSAFKVISGKTTHFSDVPIVSVNQGVFGREMILLDPQKSPLLSAKYSEFVQTLGKENKAPKMVMAKLIEFMKKHVFPHKPTGPTGDPVNLWINDWKQKHAGRPEKFIKDFSSPGTVVPLIPIDDFIHDGVGICRHHALVASYFIDRLIKSGFLPEGRVHTVREFISIPPQGGHNWIVYIPKGPGPSLHIDTLWNIVGDLNSPGERERLIQHYGERPILDEIDRFLPEKPAGPSPHPASPRILSPSPPLQRPPLLPPKRPIFFNLHKTYNGNEFSKIQNRPELLPWGDAWEELGEGGVIWLDVVKGPYSGKTILTWAEAKSFCQEELKKHGVPHGRLPGRSDFERLRNRMTFNGRYIPQILAELEKYELWTETPVQGNDQKAISFDGKTGLLLAMDQDIMLPLRCVVDKSPK